MPVYANVFTASVEEWYSHLDREAALPGRRTRLDDFGLLCLLGFYARLNRNMWGGV